MHFHHRHRFQAKSWLSPSLRWRLPATVAISEVTPLAQQVRPWLTDNGSLTQRLKRHGQFSVQPLFQGISQPSAVEAQLLNLRCRQHAVVREVLLHLDSTPVVFARSILPLASVRGANRVLSHMARRSLGAELFRAPAACRAAVWYGQYPARALPDQHNAESAWARQSLFLKHGKPLLVAEVFLPSLWRQLKIDVD